MAITLTKEPYGIYPAYNDSFIEFTSDLPDNYKAEITVYPVEKFPRVFVIYPDENGVYLFNLKESVKAIFNESGFEDDNYFTDSYYKTIAGLYLEQSIQVKVIGVSGSVEDVIPAGSELDENTTTNGTIAGIWQIRYPNANNYIEKLTDEAEDYFKISINQDGGTNPSLWSINDFDPELRGRNINLRVWIKGDASGAVRLNTDGNKIVLNFTDTWQQINTAVVFGSSFGDMRFQFYLQSTSTVFYLKQIELIQSLENEFVTKVYDFFKAVKQIGEPIHENNYQLLSYSPDGINHDLTYFEGFPFHFDIQQIESGKTVKVKNFNTGNESEGMVSTGKEAFRINIDRGGRNNWTFDNFLPLIVGLNRLGIYEGSTFKANVFLRKKKNCSGIYLKWFNRNGGFSHYLFDEYYIRQLKGSDIGKVTNNEFKNIGESTSNYKSIGKTAAGTVNVKTKYESYDYELLKDIFVSPLVQMFTATEAYVEGRFIDVFVDGVISFSNKKSKNEIALTIDLPEVQTAKL
ncbi:MAG: hypothetical protein PVG07_00155 [Acidobacteriota bacterium]|jgi:hypothetical protein